MINIVFSVQREGWLKCMINSQFYIYYDPVILCSLYILHVTVKKGLIYKALKTLLTADLMHFRQIEEFFSN